ncbi:hypothetical protein QBC46DRAFT_233777, partial [Diplogelasinospora grovesii]
QQLNGIKQPDVIAPLIIEYNLPKRARLVRLFSRAINVTNKDKLYPLRIDLVKTLAMLYKQRESLYR